MRLLRTLCFFSAVYKVILTVCHLPGVHNSTADALSRNNTKLYLALDRQASPLLTLISSELQELVFNTMDLSELDLSELDQAVQRYLGNCVAPSTRAAYCSAMHPYHNLCDRFKIQNPFPLTETIICCFVAFLGQ